MTHNDDISINTYSPKLCKHQRSSHCVCEFRSSPWNATWKIEKVSFSQQPSYRSYQSTTDEWEDFVAIFFWQFFSHPSSRHLFITHESFSSPSILTSSMIESRNFPIRYSTHTESHFHRSGWSSSVESLWSPVGFPFIFLWVVRKKKKVHRHRQLLLATRWRFQVLSQHKLLHRHNRLLLVVQLDLFGARQSHSQLTINPLNESPSHGAWE